MARFRIPAALLVLSALVLPATATAAPRAAKSPRPAATTPLAAAAAVGRRYWGTVPCNGQIRFLGQRSVAAGLAPDSDAWVTFDSPLGANNLAAPASSYANCSISLARWRWPTSASMREDWDMLCTTVVHELGHLLGHEHDATLGNVMAPVFTDYSSEPSLCRTTRPAGSGRAPR